MEHHKLLTVLPLSCVLLAVIVRLRSRWRATEPMPRISQREVERDVRAFLASGGEVNVVEWVQILTGMGTADAQAYIECLQQTSSN